MTGWGAYKMNAILFLQNQSVVPLIRLRAILGSWELRIKSGVLVDCGREV